MLAVEYFVELTFALAGFNEIAIFNLNFGLLLAKIKRLDMFWEMLMRSPHKICLKRLNIEEGLFYFRWLPDLQFYSIWAKVCLYRVTDFRRKCRRNFRPIRNFPEENCPEKWQSLQLQLKGESQYFYIWLKWA